MDETPLDVHRSHIEAFLYIRYLVQVNCKKNKSRFAESSLPDLQDGAAGIRSPAACVRSAGSCADRMCCFSADMPGPGHDGQGFRQGPAAAAAQAASLD